MRAAFAFLWARPPSTLALALAFLVVCGPTCWLMAKLVPPGHSPDEHAHVMRADSLSRGQFVGRRERAGDGRIAQGVWADTALLAISAPHQPDAMDRERWRRDRAIRWSGPEFHTLGSISGYAPIFYAPAALALAVSRGVLHQQPLAAIYAVRATNIACFLGLGLAALLLARRGAAFLFCVLAVPMTLSLASSCNQDGLLIGASALAAALITRADPRRPWDGPRSLAWVLITAIAVSKPPYSPLALLLLLPWPPAGDRLRVLAPRLAAMLAVVVLSGAWTAFVVARVSTPLPVPAGEAGPLWPGPRPAVFDSIQVADQLSVLLAQPSRFLTLPAALVAHHSSLAAEVIGVLGELTLVLPAWLYVLWLAALLIAGLAAMARRVPRPHWADTLLGIAAGLIAFWLIALSQYLTWTPIGRTVIEGVQGRYFLPLLPLVAPCAPSFPAARWVSLLGWLLPIAAALAGLLQLPLTLVGVYYLR